MTPAPVESSQPAPETMGLFARITGVFFEPGKTFEDIGRRPAWFAPLLLIILAGLTFYATYGQKVGWERAMRQQIATNARAQQQMEQIPAEKRAEVMAVQAKFIGVFYYVIAVVGFPIIILISSAISLGVSSMMSAGLRFKQVFAIVCFAGLPLVIKQVLSIVVVFLKNPDDFNLVNPLAFNIAAFMDPVSSSKFWYTLAISFDLFAIWTILLTGVGLAAAAGRKRLSFGGGFFAALVPWALFALFGATMAGMFS